LKLAEPREGRISMPAHGSPLKLSPLKLLPSLPCASCGLWRSEAVAGVRALVGGECVFGGAPACAGLLETVAAASWWRKFVGREVACGI